MNFYTKNHRDFGPKMAQIKPWNDNFDQIRHKNSNISNFLPLKKVNFETKIKIVHFSSFSRICSFSTKNGPLTHCGCGPAMADCSSRKNSGMLKWLEFELQIGVSKGFSSPCFSLFFHVFNPTLHVLLLLSSTRNIEFKGFERWGCF